MESSRIRVGGLSKSFAMRNLGLEEHRLKSHQEFLRRGELTNGKAATDLLSGYGSWEQNGAAIHSESEGSYEAGSSPVFDESFYIGPIELEAELQATSDAIEEMEGKVAIRLMVAEAVLRGIVRAVEVDASEAIEVSETELLKVKQELQQKDSTVMELIKTLKRKEEEVVKLVEESRRKERRLVMDMLTERERILGKIKESEKYVAQKEKELQKMAAHMVELSLNLAAETKRVNVLEKQIKESKEAESRKGRELLAMMEKAEQFRAEKESVLEMGRRESRLKELRWTESLADKEEDLRQQLEKIKALEAAELQLREEVDVRNQKELHLTESLAEKERVISHQLETIRTLTAAEQQLKEEVDVRDQKVQELTESLGQKERVVSQQHERINGVETVERQLREELDVRSRKELHLSETLAVKERVLSQQLEAINSLENAQQKLREELDVRSQKEEQLTESLQEREKVVGQHLHTIKALETSEQQLRKELDYRTQKEVQLTQSLVDKENLVNEHLQTMTSLESAEAELKEELNSERRKVQDLSEDLSAKGEELSKKLVTIQSLQVAEKEQREVIENHGQKERFLMGELLEKDEVISKQRALITTLESAEQELRKESEVQREKVRDLMKSGKDNSEVLDKLRDTVKFQADSMEEKDRSLRFLQGEIELLNFKIGDLSSVRATLNEKVESYEAEVENQRMQIVMQEAFMRESEIRSQELSLREKHLQDEVASLNVQVLEYKDAAQLSKYELQEQIWKHQTETAVIMTTLEGRVLDLEREINLLGEEPAGNQAETVTFKSQTLQMRSLEISNLRSSKLNLEAKLSDAQSALEVLEETAKKQEDELESKDVLLGEADSRITHLEQKLMKNQIMFDDFQKEVDKMKIREENLKKQQQDLESEVRMVRQNLDSASHLGQDLRAKESHLQGLVEQLEEKVWRLEFEIMFISTYVENVGQDVLNLVVDVNKRSTASEKTMAHLQLELKAASVELSKSKEEIDRLRSELSTCVERMQSNSASNAKNVAEAIARLEIEAANSGRLKAHICELESQLNGLRIQLEDKLLMKEKEATQLMLSLEESEWQNEAKSIIVMGVAEGSIQELIANLAHAREEIKKKTEDIGSLRCEVEELSKKLRAYASNNSELKIALASKTQEICTFTTYFVLQNAMQRDALLQGQTQAKEALKKIEELKRLKLTLLERIQEEKQRRVQLEEALREQKWKYQFEMDIFCTLLSEAALATAARNVEIEREVGRSLHEHRRGDDSKKVGSLKGLSSGTDTTGRCMKGKPSKASVELKASKVPLSKLDLLVRENEELRREKEQLLTEKTDEIYKLKGEFYKELERVKVERRRDYESDGSQESPKSRGTLKPRQLAVTGPEVKQTDDDAKLKRVVADHKRKVSEMRALWDAEKATLQKSLSGREAEITELLTELPLKRQAQLSDYSEKLEKLVVDHESKVSELKALWDAEKDGLLESLSRKEDEIKEMVDKLSSQSQPQQNEDSARLETVVADHEKKVSEMRVVWDAEKAALLETLSRKEDEIKEMVHKLSSRSQAQQNEDTARLEKVVADHEKKVSEMRVGWDAEKSTLQESLSQREDELKELLTKLSLQSRVKPNDDSAKLEKVVADHERRVSDMRATWDAEKSAVEEQIRELITELTQALEKERESLTRQSSLEEKLAAVEKERSQLKALHKEELQYSAAVHRNELDATTRKLTEAVKDAQEKGKRVRELEDEVRQMKDEISVLRFEISSVRKQMDTEFAREVQSLVASLRQLERGVTQRTKQYNLRLQRAHSLLNHLVRQCRFLVSSEAAHMQNLQNLKKAEAEVDLLGDEVDALMDVLEKVYTVLGHYHPVIQHYPGLADLAKVVRYEVLQRLRESDDVSL